MLARTLDAECAAHIARAAQCRNFDPRAPREILRGDRRRVGEHLGDGSLGDHLTAVLSRAGPEIDQVVGGTDRLLVVLDDDHRVAQVAQPHERREESRVVALVQPYARLVENVEHAHEARPDLRGEPNALRFPARERFRAPVQREILEPDVDEKAQPLAHFLQYGPGDVRVEARLSGRANGDRDNEVVCVVHRELAELADVPAGDRDGERFGFEPQPFTFGANGDDHVLFELAPDRVARRLVVAALTFERIPSHFPADSRIPPFL